MVLQRVGEGRAGYFGWSQRGSGKKTRDEADGRSGRTATGKLTEALLKNRHDDAVSMIFEIGIRKKKASV